MLTSSASLVIGVIQIGSIRSSISVPRAIPAYGQRPISLRKLLLKTDDEHVPGGAPLAPSRHPTRKSSGARATHGSLPAWVEPFAEQMLESAATRRLALGARRPHVTRRRELILGNTEGIF